ncbi:interferon regulatory factor 4 isoform X2 [Patella vulgata]|uniref:interferon regulatory factor 4 isoform X2 n=1 Tax=Patella vulgata TaxID=6465 RepID=UPI00217FF868|nr:interferon regulatory factor 4 isoform X2 [Patella vulgata]
MMPYYNPFPFQNFFPGNMQGNTEYHGRQRLRPWLISKVDSQKFPGLMWVNKSEGMFRVPWKHGGKQDWSEQNSLIFKEWAMHTGRHQAGVDKDDWPVWKTRFRCALNKLPDIEEVKQLSQLDGEEPYRVYRFLQTTKSKCIPDRTNGKTPCIKREPSYQRIPEGPINLSMSKYNPSCIPETVRDINFTDQEEIKVPIALTSDLGDIDVCQLVGSSRQRSSVLPQTVSQEEDMDTTDGRLMIDEKPYPTDITTGAPRGQRIYNLPPKINIQQIREPQDHEILVRIQFRQKVVAQYHVTNPHGLRLYYGQGPSAFVDPNQMYGSGLAQPIEFPLCELTDNPEQRRYTEKLLSCLDRGLTLECRDGDIYAIRKCRVVVFVASPDSNRPIKINRDSSSCKIFDYAQFKKALENYAGGQGSKPSAQILLGFGQNWTNSLEPYQNLLISATIYHPKAIYDLSKIAGRELLSPPLQISDSDEVDRYIKIYKDISKTIQD